MNLTEARLTLLRSILHTADQDFDSSTLDRAIRGSFNRFIRETGLGRGMTDVDTAANESDLDVTKTDSQFSPGLLYSVPYILTSGSSQWEPIRVGSFNTVRYGHEQSTATGRPEVISWLSADAGIMLPTPDAVYRIRFPWKKPLIEWTIGIPDGSGVELNVPERYIDDLLWHGSRAYLLRGLPGHPEAESSMDEFKELIVQAKGEDQPAGVWFANLGEDTGRAYGQAGYIN